jgi:hypothetical protein
MHMVIVAQHQVFSIPIPSLALKSIHHCHRNLRTEDEFANCKGPAL